MNAQKKIKIKEKIKARIESRGRIRDSHPMLFAKYLFSNEKDGEKDGEVKFRKSKEVARFRYPQISTAPISNVNLSIYLHYAS